MQNQTSNYEQDSVAPAYIVTRAALTMAPPMISLIQCTPDRSLPITIKQVNVQIVSEAIRLNQRRLMREFSCRIAVGITHIVSMVVEDG